MARMLPGQALSDQSRKDQYKHMADIIIRHTTESGEDKTAVDGLYLSRKSKPSLPRYIAQWPCVAIVVQGQKTVTLGQQIFHYGVGDYTLVSIDLPVISQVTIASPASPQLALGIEIKPETLRQLFDRIGSSGQALKPEEFKGISVNTVTSELLDAFLRLLRLLDQKEDIKVMAPLIELEILYRVITGPYGRQLLRFAMENAPDNRIAKAIAWLRANYTETVKIKLLAQKVGMSESSFHEHFKAVTLLTPLQYQKKLRLHEARKLMLINRMDANEAAFQVGYQSPAQFSREYSRLYGNSPIRDVINLRKEHQFSLQ